MTARRTQHEAARKAHEALENKFTAYGVELKRVEVLKYLGRSTSFINLDVPALRYNLGKARGTWQRISRVLRVENIPAPICVMFYKAVVLSVLLYGSESWNVPKAEMAALEGFHVAAACHLTGMRPRQLPSGAWHYPSSNQVLRAARLHKVVEYVGVRRRQIMRKMKDHPVLELIQ
jgi:hypothetical protein